jgi:syntaxin 5
MLTMSHTSTIQDRTPEFRTILLQAQKSLARQRKPGSSQQAQPLLTPQQQQNGTATPTRKQRSEFARNAAQIGRGIGATMGKLERLGELAKRKTLFDDKPIEIAELTYVIKQDLAGLNQAIEKLDQQAKATGVRTEGGKDLSDHNQNVAVLLQRQLGDLGLGFKDVLEVRSKNMQASKSRQDNFVSSVTQTTTQQPTHLDPGRTDSPLYNAPSRGRSPKPGERQQQNAGDVVLSLDGPGNTSSPLYGNANQQAQLQEFAPQDNSYIQQRGEAITQIESTINELGGIFSQLAQMVSEQSEQIQRIDANTDDVVDNVEGAQRELMKYWSRVQGNRWLVAKMFGVLMIFFLVWVLVAG